MLSALQAQVFTPNCTFSSCHSSGGVAGSLVLEPGKSFANLVNHGSAQTEAAQEKMLRVSPGNPDHSLLLLKLRGDLDARYGRHMPDTGQQLDPGDLDAIAGWIRLGAQDD